MSKTQRQIRTRSITHQTKPAVSPMLIGIVVVISFLIVGGLIWLGNLQSSNANATVGFDQFPAKGSEEAPVVMVEYSDFGCPHCRDYVLNTEDLIDQSYINSGQVRYIVHSFNLGRPETALAAEAAWCAADQDLFFAYQRATFENFGVSFNQSNLISLAGQVEGLDQNAFSQCLSSRAHQNDVEVARRAAAQQGVNSTPTFFIGRQAETEQAFFSAAQKVEGNQPFELLQQVIEQELARAR